MVQLTDTLLLDLLIDVKNNLRITWDDEDVDLKKLIIRSVAYLDNLTGAPLDYSEEDSPKELLLERCRYVYNNAADEFEPNFHRELSRLIMKVAIKDAKANEETS